MKWEQFKGLKGLPVTCSQPVPTINTAALIQALKASLAKETK